MSRPRPDGPSGWPGSAASCDSTRACPTASARRRGIGSVTGRCAWRRARDRPARAAPAAGHPRSRRRARGRPQAAGTTADAFARHRPRACRARADPAPAHVGYAGVEAWWRARSGLADPDQPPPGPWPVSVADTRGILRREPITPPLARAIRETLAARRRVFLVVAGSPPRSPATSAGRSSAAPSAGSRSRIRAPPPGSSVGSAPRRTRSRTRAPRARAGGCRPSGGAPSGSSTRCAGDFRWRASRAGSRRRAGPAAKRSARRRPAPTS